MGFWVILPGAAGARPVMVGSLEGAAVGGWAPHGIMWLGPFSAACGSLSRYASRPRARLWWCALSLLCMASVVAAACGAGGVG
jgi:hypothetical protein